MMRWFTARDIYDSMRPFARLLKFFGFDCGASWDRNPTAGLLIPLMYVAFFVTYHAYATAIATSIIPSEIQLDEMYNSVILSLSENVYAVLLYLVIVISILINYFCRDVFQYLLKTLHEADQVLVELKQQFDYRKHHLLLVVATLMFVLTTTIIISVYIWFYRKAVLGASLDFTSVFIFATNFTSFLMIVNQATVLVKLTEKRFAALNHSFRMYFPTNPTCSGFPSVHTETTVCSEKEQLTVIKQIKILHDKLNDVVELVNYCFSVQITFCVGLCFVIGVVCSFGLFRAFIYRNELFYMGVLNFIWYMYYLFFVLFFIAVGSKITREGKRIGVLVHKAINCSTSSAVINELNIFSQQLLHRSPVITCGLFVYDWTLLYTMIGATATYLIILIQFDVSFPNLVNVNNGTTSTGSAGT
ncbi:uncharacterized protein LOC129727139 isoform X2 [Wyeomyia smithii]|uniref:uncharacterized protein LOC129727139 isoform X2 n=1 Tax=Wyeomyia smithii TaxID=174621 RepID=UPI002467E878|nr:uncharacterized protein LOC129727139 isoform X2 [Wyeomyia smithii]